MRSFSVNRVNGRFLVTKFDKFIVGQKRYRFLVFSKMFHLVFLLFWAALDEICSREFILIPNVKLFKLSEVY